MKRLTNSILQIEIDGINIDDVSRILFKFKHGNVVRLFEYPSDKVIRISDNILGIMWDINDTGSFSSNADVNFDTQIWLTESEQNPETIPSNFRLTPSLFTKEEVTVE